MLDRGREFGQGGLLGRGRNRGRDGRNGGLIALGVSGLAAGIGLASESIKSHRENKARAANQQQVASSSRSISQPDIRVNDIESEGIREEPPPSYSEEDLQQSRSYPVERKVAREIKREMSSHEVSYEEVAGSSREYEEPPPEYGENLEDEWNLDDAQDDEIGDGVYDAPSTEAGKVEDLFIRKHPPPARNSHGSEGLAMPVVIPQRRPKERARGFVRAYAPVLENCGIDQATWMEFLEVFQKSGTANPWLNAINLAQFATMAIPSFGIGLAVGYAIQQATKAAIELDGRAKTNMFMTKLNNEFFRPRGLYALVMTWNPNSDQAIQHVNLTQTIASRNTQNSGLSGIHDRYRTSDGVTQSDWEFPEVAPLIFPALDALATQASRGSATPSKIAGAKAVVGDYFDRRATAAYVSSQPHCPSPHSALTSNHPGKSPPKQHAGPRPSPEIQLSLRRPQLSRRQRLLNFLRLRWQACAKS